jgi:hypothetical protein
MASTDRKASVEDRLAETVSEVKIFCLYTGTSFFLVFLFILILFCACLAYSGMFEDRTGVG